MHLFARIILLFISASVFSQIDSTKIASEKFVPDFTAVDSLYREDQFYFSFTYNILTSIPKKLNQNKFSLGLSGGFLRDFPLNKQRNFALAIGLGYTLQNYNYNLKVSESNSVITYSYVDEDSFYDKNKLSVNYVDIPLEIRWRTSVPESHKFWRVYTGFKFSYLFYSRSKFTGDGGKNLVVNNPDLSKLRMSAYVSAGYNTWNFYACYGFTPIFDNGSIEGQKIKMGNLSLGLMFYIL
ncbi:porin family protein [Flavobacterium silvaticum]|uniref:PorT family protein n=1 Tax=Flavobacterium silvaticum TaxID=1852020 RepID=A0A972FM52_9FLAO|nr:porin family protein [Flavobacterium silvaticum]NMH28599.1 PorT family protein [Flavobacterium silvaticum]